jgi:hypothetical protein
MIDRKDKEDTAAATAATTGHKAEEGRATGESAIPNKEVGAAGVPNVSENKNAAATKDEKKE